MDNVSPPLPLGEGSKLVRREFFASFLRSAAAAGVTGVSAVLMLRTARLPAAECLRQTACRGCPEWGGCVLPPALAARRVGATAGVSNSPGVAARANQVPARGAGKVGQERVS
jgi:hypothetical protein